MHLKKNYYLRITDRHFNFIYMYRRIDILIPKQSFHKNHKSKTANIFTLSKIPTFKKFRVLEFMCSLNDFFYVFYTSKFYLLSGARDWYFTQFYNLIRNTGVCHDDTTFVTVLLMIQSTLE